MDEVFIGGIWGSVREGLGVGLVGDGGLEVREGRTGLGLLGGIVLGLGGDGKPLGSVLEGLPGGTCTDLAGLLPSIELGMGGLLSPGFRVGGSLRPGMFLELLLRPVLCVGGLLKPWTGLFLTGLK